MAKIDDFPQHKVPTLKPNLNRTQYLDGIPRPLSPKELPSKYKPTERRVRIIIIALPVAIVTSFTLWNRLINGEERKVLTHTSPTADGNSTRPTAA